MSCPNRRRKLTSAAFNVVPCDKSRQELEESKIKEAYNRSVVHVKRGSPAETMTEWERLAREDEEPS